MQGSEIRILVYARVCSTCSCFQFRSVEICRLFPLWFLPFLWSCKHWVSKETLANLGDVPRPTSTMLRRPVRMAEEWWRRWGCVAWSIYFEEEHASHLLLSERECSSPVFPQKAVRKAVRWNAEQRLHLLWIFLYKTSLLTSLSCLESLCGFCCF